jgi:hypothetical protein
MANVALSSRKEQAINLLALRVQAQPKQVTWP